MALLDIAPRSFGEYEAAGGGRGLEVALRRGPRRRHRRGGEERTPRPRRRGVPDRREVAVDPKHRHRAPGSRCATAPRASRRRSRTAHLLGANPYQVLEGLAIAAYAVGAERCLRRREGDVHHEVGGGPPRGGRRWRRRMRSVGIPFELVTRPRPLPLRGGDRAGGGHRGPPASAAARPAVHARVVRRSRRTTTRRSSTTWRRWRTCAHILADGPDWLRSSGTETSPGTMVFTVCGDVRREGVFELPLGTPLRELVEGCGGGAPEGRSVKALFPGASNTVIIPEQLDTPMDFDSMRQVGSGLGAGGLRGLRRSAPAWCGPRALYSRFLWVESCGQCPACKFGTGEVTKASTRSRRPGLGQDVESILVRARGSTDGQKCALPTGESLLMQSVVQVFGDEFRAHVRRAVPAAPATSRSTRSPDGTPRPGRSVYDASTRTGSPTGRRRDGPGRGDRHGACARRRAR